MEEIGFDPFGKLKGGDIECDIRGAIRSPARILTWSRCRKARSKRKMSLEKS